MVLLSVSVQFAIFTHSLLFLKEIPAVGFHLQKQAQTVCSSVHLVLLFPGLLTQWKQYLNFVGQRLCCILFLFVSDFNRLNSRTNQLNPRPVAETENRPGWTFNHGHMLSLASPWIRRVSTEAFPSFTAVTVLTNTESTKSKGTQNNIYFSYWSTHVFVSLIRCMTINIVRKIKNRYWRSYFIHSWLVWEFPQGINKVWLI